MLSNVLYFSGLQLNVYLLYFQLVFRDRGGEELHVRMRKYPTHVPFVSDILC